MFFQCEPYGCVSLPLQDLVAVGLFFTKIGYFFLMFGYFLLIRYRKSKRVYWLYFSLFFIFMAVSRVFYMFYDYFTPGNLVAWRLATATAWVGVASLSGILSILLFTGEGKVPMALKRIFPLIPLAIGIHVVFLPDFWIDSTFATGRFYMNFIILPIYVILVPFMFFYLAKRSVGALQRSFFLNGLGFLIYYVARAIQGPVIVALAGGAGFWSALTTPLLGLFAILLIAFANQYEHLK